MESIRRVIVNHRTPRCPAFRTRSNWPSRLYVHISKYLGKHSSVACRNEKERKRKRKIKKLVARGPRTITDSGRTAEKTDLGVRHQFGRHGRGTSKKGNRHDSMVRDRTHHQWNPATRTPLATRSANDRSIYRYRCAASSIV